MKEWDFLILVFISSKFGGGSLVESCATNFLIFTWSRDNFMWHVGMVVFHSDMYSHVQWLQPSSELLYDVFNFSHDHLIKDHVIGRLGTISSFLQNLFHILYPFLKLWHNSIENWYYKVGKLLQNYTKLCY